LDGSATAAVTLHGDRAVVVEHRGRRFADVGELLRAGPAALEAARAAAGAPGVAYAREQLRQPIAAPGAVLCVGLNYRDHIVEMGHELPEQPTYFGKLARALTGPYATLDVPGEAAPTLDYEGELAIVIGTAGRDVAAADAWQHVAGLTILNDVSVRAHQWRTSQWLAGKTWQSLTPFGPAVVTADELPELGQRELVTRVNGDVRQRSQLHNLVFGVQALVADVSRIVELAPGDLISTGTPGGVGAGMKPPGYLRDGDRVEVEIDGIGAIENVVRVVA